jgi:hypothetical protein
MINVDFTSKPLIPIASAPVSSHERRMSSIGCLMPRFHDLVTVVCQNDIDEVFADVVYVTFDSSDHHRAFICAFDTVKERLQELNAAFMPPRTAGRTEAASGPSQTGHPLSSFRRAKYH